MTTNSKPAVTAISKSMISGNYLRDAWYVAAWCDDLAEGQLLAREIMNEPIVFYRKADLSVAALSDRCPHRFAPLHMGKIVKGERVQCPYHGLEFDGAGACVNNPHGTHNIPPRARVRSYATIEKHRAIWIWMGDKNPDYAKVPDFSVLDNAPRIYETKRDRITIKAHYELIVDNLLDLSHVPFLHDGILGNQDTIHAEITFEQDGNDVIVGREAKNVSPPGLFATFLPSPNQRVDQFSIIRCMAASNLRLFTGVTMPGKPHDAGTGFHAIHLLTPETDRTTHYFFTAVRFNVMTEGDQLNTQIQENISKMRRYAFQEQDAPVIEAQQRNLDASQTPFDPVLLSVDVGPVRYKRILQKMIETELTP